MVTMTANLVSKRAKNRIGVWAAGAAVAALVALPGCDRQAPEFAFDTDEIPNEEGRTLEFGKAEGFGLPGTLEPYEVGDELRAKMKPYGFEAGWFRRGGPAEGTAAYVAYTNRLAHWIAIGDKKGDCTSCTVERIPYLFRRGPGSKPLPLVVYLPGNGEQGEDLVKQFRQTAVMDAVSSAAFQREHPCHLLVVMPPDFANCNAYVGHSKSGNPDLQLMYADLIFQLARERAAIDQRKVVLVGLGSGGTAAVAMEREWPGRFAGVCGFYCSPWYKQTIRAERPGNWWWGHTTRVLAYTSERLEPWRKAIEEAGGRFRLSFYPEIPNDNWWNAPWRQPELTLWLADCFSRGVIHGEKKESDKPAKSEPAKVEPTYPKLYLVKTDDPHAARCVPRELATNALFTAREEIRHLTIDAAVEGISAGSFAGLPALETVYFDKPTPVGSRAFADCPALTLVDFGDLGNPRNFAADAFAGVTNLTAHYPYVTTKPMRRETVEPGDGKPFTRFINAGDDCRHRLRLFLEDGFLWADDPSGATALISLAEDGRVIVPAEFRGKPTVAVGRYLLPDRKSRYRFLVLPASVTKIDLFQNSPKVDVLFGQCRTDGSGVRPCIDGKTRVYGTKPDPRTGRLVYVLTPRALEKRLPSTTDPLEYLKRIGEMEEEKEGEK